MPDIPDIPLVAPALELGEGLGELPISIPGMFGLIELPGRLQELLHGASGVDEDWETPGAPGPGVCPQAARITGSAIKAAIEARR